MRRVVTMLVVLGACGGPQVPQHNGYKSEKAKPWKKPKALALDEKLEMKTEGELSYPDMRRARWYSVDVPSSGELALKLEITPPGETANEDFDLALEVFDPSYHVVAKSDLEEQDAHELNKTRVVKVKHGQYLIQVYLQSRMDTAEYILRGAFKQTAAEDPKTNFPALVAFIPLLPMVPLADDTPKSQIKQTPIAVTHVTHRDPVRPKDPVPPPPVATSARILNMSVVQGGTQITIGRGTGANPPALNGMKAHLSGIAGAYGLANCNEKVCFALIEKATPDQIKNAGGNVSITP